MSDEKTSAILSSVIQRTLVPHGLGTVLNVASTPITDLCDGSLDETSDDDFRDLVAQIVGIPPASILDESQYTGIVSSIRSGVFFENLRRHSHGPFSHELYYIWNHELQHFLTAGKREGVAQQTGETRQQLALDSIFLMLSPTNFSGLRNGLLSYPAFLPVGVQDPNLAEMHITPEALDLGISCILSSVDPDPRVRDFTHAAGLYEIPTGNSPTTSAENLLKILETSKKVCLAPLAVGGTTAITQLAQGGYVTALLTSLTAGAMTLVFIGTVSVAHLLVQKTVHMRKTTTNHRRPRKTKGA